MHQRIPIGHKGNTTFIKSSSSVTDDDAVEIFLGFIQREPPFAVLLQAVKRVRRHDLGMRRENRTESGEPVCLHQPCYKKRSKIERDPHSRVTRPTVRAGAIHV